MLMAMITKEHTKDRNLTLPEFSLPFFAASLLATLRPQMIPKQAPIIRKVAMNVRHTLMNLLREVVLRFSQQISDGSGARS